MDEATRAATPLAEQLTMALHDERGPMTVDDLLALPSSPLIVAEGTQITPKLAGDGSNALWLIPSREVRRDRLEARHGPGGPPPLYLFLGQLIEDEVRRAGAQTLVIERETTVEQTMAAVEEYFADALASGPKAETAHDRRALLRYANRAIVSQYRAFFARPWSSGDLSSAVAAFECECADPECDANVELPVTDFPTPPDDHTSPPVVAAGHSHPDFRSGRAGHPEV